LHACSHVRILATSREAFGTLSALTWRVPALSETDAVYLFADRARQSRPDFALSPRNTPIIATICAQLDGMPLAIELAATRARAMSVEQIAERLLDRLNLLTSIRTTAAPRQQTLRATIDWSYLSGSKTS
jgi:predicted ATPase